jgi:hypothetical protein
VWEEISYYDFTRFFKDVVMNIPSVTNKPQTYSRGFLFGILIILVCSIIALAINQYSSGRNESGHSQSALTIVSQGFSKILDRRVTVANLNKGDEIKIVNSSTLNSELNKLGFWKEKKVTILLGGYPFQITTSGLEISLANYPQKYGEYYTVGDTHPVSSYGVSRRSSNVIELSIWMNKDVIPDAEKDFVLNRAFLTAIYDMTHWTSPGTPDPERIKYIEKIHKIIQTDRKALPLSCQ